TVVVESVLPYTLSSITFLVSLGFGSPTFVGFISVYFHMMSLSPQMLILRVISGRTWDNDTFNRLHLSIRFNHAGRDTSRSQVFDSNGTKSQLRTRSLLTLPVSVSDIPAKVEVYNR
ncbi:hypothetical protein V8E55_009615, partial [Tylopilus felleus]